MTTEDFNKMNLQRVERGEPIYSNPRNTASGSLKLQDSSQVAKRPLKCFIYAVAGDELNLYDQFAIKKLENGDSRFLILQDLLILLRKFLNL